MGCGFDRRVNCSKMTVAPTESEMGSQDNVIILPLAARLLIVFVPAKIYVVKMLVLKT